jgi:type IV pilus assembly protein PilM
VDYYLSQGAERSISKVVLSGGSSNIKGLAAYMSAELKVPVDVLNPFSFLADQGAQIPADLKPAMAVAVGLALRRLKDWV